MTRRLHLGDGGGVVLCVSVGGVGVFGGVGVWVSGGGVYACACKDRLPDTKKRRINACKEL